MSKLTDLLKKIGFTAEEITNVTKADADFDVEEVYGDLLPRIDQARLNDASFVEANITPVRSAAIGEVLGAKEREVLRLLGGKMTSADIDAIPKDNKRFNKVLEMAVSKLSAGSPGSDQALKDKDAEITRIREELQAHATEVQKYKTEVVPGLEKKATEAGHHFHILRSIEEAAKSGDRKTVLAADKTTGLLYDDIAKQYDLAWDPAAGVPVIKQKGKDLLAYSPTDASKPMGIADLVGTIGEASGYFVKNNGKPEGGGGTTRDDGNKGGGAAGPTNTTEPPGLRAARERAKASAKA
jgi:hypothetical protein